MAKTKTKEPDFERTAPALDEEDGATLAAIDEGLRDAKSGRTIPVEQVRELLPKWISASSSRKEL
jgi:predicted transcriptional regulator